VLANLSRYTHRVAISNSRLVALDDKGVTFRWKDYRAEGRERQTSMSLATGEFIRRFLIHVLPSRFQGERPRHCARSYPRADQFNAGRTDLLDLLAPVKRGIRSKPLLNVWFCRRKAGTVLAHAFFGSATSGRGIRSLLTGGAMYQRHGGVIVEPLRRTHAIVASPVTRRDTNVASRKTLLTSIFVARATHCHVFLG
jgi:hypothetical protein